MTEFNYCPECAQTLADGACPDGHFVHYDNPVPAVICFLEREDGRFLVFRRAREPMKGSWDMPGGFVEPLEHPEDAVRRELREETALDIEVRGLIGVFPSVYGDTGKKTLDFAYLCRVAGGEFTLSDESAEHAWLPLEEFPELAFKAERDSLAALLESR